MRIFLIVFFAFSCQFSIGQFGPDYAAIDNKMAAITNDQTTTTAGISDYINSNFKTESEKIRAVYFWTASNISYDVPNMYQLNNTDSPETKIANALKTRKGVCIHYAEVFKDISSKVGIKTYLVPGYTKQFGEIAPISHVWCASKIDGKWFLFDPTWGAGFIDGKKFTKKLNSTYFKRDPDRMIITHMPFDYMWQLLNSPLTNTEFINEKPDPNKAKGNFDFITEIDKYEKLSDANKAFECAARVEKNGLLNNLIQDYYNLKKREFTVLTQNKSVEKLVVIAADFNQAIRDLNDFILFRNKKFKPAQSDETLKKMIQDVKEKMNKCKDEVYNVGSVSPENTANLNSLKKAILQGIDKTKEQEDFVKEYLSKGVLARKLMFTNLR